MRHNSHLEAPFEALETFPNWSNVLKCRQYTIKKLMNDGLTVKDATKLMTLRGICLSRTHKNIHTTQHLL